MNKNEILKAELQNIVKLQEKMKPCYFWQPPQKASQRRQYERYNSNLLEFELNGHYYKFEQETKCSCKNIYFYSAFYEDGTKKDIRLVKKLLKGLL